MFKHYFKYLGSTNDPRPRLFKPITPKRSQVSCISDLLNEDGNWNISLLNELMPKDVQVISAIIMPS